MNSYTAICKTNIDAYNSSHFPILPIIPRIGEAVTLLDGLIPIYIIKGLPTRLEVVDVIYFQSHASIELTYRKIDIEAAKLSGNLKTLFGQ